MHNSKFIYLGLQRCGTKTFGDFFKKNNYRVFSRDQTEKFKLMDYWFNCDWNKIISLNIFNDYDVFEDFPFCDPVFVRYLSNNIQNLNFVYFDRPSVDWYKSMVTHTDGMNPGNILYHSFL